MRTYYKISIVFVVLVLVLQACTKSYEVLPLGHQITDEYVFSQFDSAGVLANRYYKTVYLKALWSEPHSRLGGNHLDAASDDALSSMTGQPDVFKLLTGAISSYNPVDDIWSQSYEAIRYASVFINKFPIVPLNEKLPNGQSAKPSYIAEARFLRAFTYFELVKRYGGVPLMGNTVRQITDEVSLPRNSFADCINYIVSELDAIKDSLRVQATINSTTYGKVTQGAAMALKAKTLLFAASPLFNGGNIDGVNPLTGYSNFDLNRWKLAADAAKSLIDLNAYSLMPSFNDVFLTQAAPVGINPEIIFWRQNGSNANIEKSNGPVGYSTAGSTGNMSVTQNLVDAFPTNTGLSITDQASEYNPDNMYNNRDPRLKWTVFYNGVLWLNRQVETFAGGLDRPGGAIQQTKTGYYARKFMGNYESSGNGQYPSHYEDFPYIRYAEILLDYAEATNEFSGTDASVYQVLYDIRKRAGIIPGSNSTYGVNQNMTQDEMRIAIQNERRIELAFEDQRYFDLRRWKIADKVYALPLFGQDIQRTTSGQLFFNKVVVLQPLFRNPQMYLYPIPINEVLKNKNMVQNPRW